MDIHSCVRRLSYYTSLIPAPPIRVEHLAGPKENHLGLRGDLRQEKERCCRTHRLGLGLGLRRGRGRDLYENLTSDSDQGLQRGRGRDLWTPPASDSSSESEVMYFTSPDLARVEVLVGARDYVQHASFCSGDRLTVRDDFLLARRDLRHERLRGWM